MSVIASLNTVFSADTGDMDAAFKSMRQAQAEATRLTDQARGPLGEYMQSLDRIGAIYDAGGISLQDYNTSLDMARAAYQKAIGPTAEMVRHQEELARQTEETARALDMAEEAAHRWDMTMLEGARVTNANLTPLERYEQELSDLDRLLDANAISFDTWQRAATKAFGKLTAGAKPVATLTDRLRSLGSEIKNSLAGNIAAAFSIRAMGQFVGDAFAAVDAMHDLSVATGATTQQIAALRVAASTSGSSTEAIDESLKKLNKTLGNADESKKIQSSLDAIGMSAEQLRSMGVGNAFVAISEAMKGIEDPAMRAKIASDLFGKSGSDLLNVLALGRDGFEQAAAQAEAFGLSVNAVDAANVNEAGDAVDRMKMAVEGLGTQLAVTFAPLVEWFSNTLPGAIKTAQAVFVSYIRSLVTGIGGVVTAASYLPEWLGGGVASDASQFINTLVEELSRTEKELLEQAKVLNQKGIGTKTNTFQKPVIEVAQVATDGLDNLVNDVKGFFDFATAAAQKAQQVAAQQGVKNLMDAGMGFAEFLKQAKVKGDAVIQDKAASVLESVMTPLEKFDKTMADLEALKNLGAINPDTFARASAQALNQLNSATSSNAPTQRASLIERGTAEAFKAERQGKDSPAKTQKEILDQAKKQTRLQEQQLKAFQEGGPVPVTF